MSILGLVGAATAASAMASATPAQAVEAVPGTVSYDVISEGAIADATNVGGTDNTAAFQRAMDKAWGSFGLGGTMIINPGAFHVKGQVKFRSNVKIIAIGATVRKYSTSSGYAVFVAETGTSKGYGASVKNIYVEGLTFKGSFTAGQETSCGVTLHHVDGAVFVNCVWDEAIMKGHGIDSVGSRGLRVRGCTFKGFNPQPNQEYVEAIQLDYSLAGAGGADTLFDGLPTIDVIIEDNKFIPLTVGSKTYPAPNPVGSHSRVQERWIEDIKFINNYVEGCHAPTTTDSFALTCKGWLHFFCTRNVEVRGNHFKNVPGRAARVFGAYPITSGTKVSDVNTVDAATTMVPMPMMNALIADNTFEGFDSTALEPLIWIGGTEASNGRGIKVRDNTLKDCFPTTGVTANEGADFVYLNDVTGVTLTDNNMDRGRTLFYGVRVKKINISGGQLNDLGHHIARFSACDGIKITNVDVDGHGGGYYFYNACTGIDIDGGSILGGRADAVKPKHMTFSGATEFSVRNVHMPFDAANGYTHAIDAYSGSTMGRVNDNMVKGWSDATLVKIGSGTQVTKRDNVYA